MTNSTPNLDSAAATLAASAVSTTERAAKLDNNDEAFARVAERNTEHLDATGLYDSAPYADLYDAAYNALANHVAWLLA